QHERRLLLDSFNPATPLAPDAHLAHELFEEQVQRTPNATALVYEGESLSYVELNACANQLARYLTAHGAAPNSLVGLFLERSARMIVALLGILKAGCAYVPLDPSYPPERLRQMLTESSPTTVLTDQKVTALLQPTAARLLPIDATAVAGLECGDVDVTRLGVDAHSAAYVIFTSGSTGAPKGVIVTHRNLVSSSTARMQYYPEPSRFLLLSPLGFDSSVAGIFGTLLQGGTLIIAPQEAIQDPAVLLRTIQQHEPTCLLCVPALYRALLGVPGTALANSTVSKVILAGEACPASLIAESAARAPGIRIFNEYGPTEATVWATVFECQFPLTDTVVPIGRPIANTRVYILNTQLQPVPLEAVGELFIGGAGVARGYLHQPDLTEEHFLPDPFSPEIDARMYRTGDLARWRLDGTLEYLGRNDSQVKLRGYRVELSEIEAQLTQHERIREAAAVVREDSFGEKRLVAYVVPRALTATAPAPSASEINTASLRTYLREKLPDFMVPHSIVVLDRLPMTPNGKLDRQALPAAQTMDSDYEEPRGRLEEQVAGIWSHTLRLPRIGREDNFFELGGHSLTAMRTIVRLRAALSLDLPITILFKHPTVRELATHVEEIQQQQLLDLLKASAGDTEELTRKISFLSDSQAAELARQIIQGIHR
ncbi:MAG TPA: non-ribosomal peptide synthetase, partial [Steroidobacteraceae bacterium]